MTAYEHNSLRFWALRQCNQDPRRAERLARSISGAIRALPKVIDGIRTNAVRELLFERQLNGWDFVAQKLGIII